MKEILQKMKRDYPHLKKFYYADAMFKESKNGVFAALIGIFFAYMLFGREDALSYSWNPFPFVVVICLLMPFVPLLALLYHYMTDIRHTIQSDIDKIQSDADDKRRVEKYQPLLNLFHRENQR